MFQPRRKTILPWITCACLSFHLGCQSKIQGEENTQTPQSEEKGSESSAPRAEASPPPAVLASRSDGVGIEGIPVNPEQIQAGIPHLRFAVELDESPMKGHVDADAPVTIVMFSDFECPYCLQSHRVLQQLSAEYPDKIRLVYKAFPLGMHPSAMIAAMIAEAAEERGTFWTFHDLLFSGEELSFENLIRYAETSKLDIQQLQTEITDYKYASNVRRDMRLARRFDINSTPVFFVNGRMIGGAMPIEAFREMVDEEILLAEQWKRQGVEDIYAHATAHAYGSIVYEEASGEPDQDMVYPVPIGNSPQEGLKSAPLTVVVFGDFQCPFCVRGHRTLTKLKAIYGSKLRIVYKFSPLPNHPGGYVASRGALYALKKGKFMEYYNRVYDFGARFDLTRLLELGEAMGFDADEFSAALNDDAFDAQIIRDQELSAALGVRGTPAYFINGRPILGARGEMHFRMLFAEELERAQERLDKGISPENLYNDLAGIE